MSITRTGQDEVTRAQLQTAIEESVDAGFLGVVLRVRDEHGQWVGSADAHTEAATRYQLIAHHGEEQGSAAARLTTLVETWLRAAGVRIPRP